MAEYEISHPRIPQIGNTVLEGPDDLPPPTERDYWDAVRQQGVRPMALGPLKDGEKVSAYKNGYFDDPDPVEGQPEQPGIVDSLLDLGGKAVLRGSQMANVLTAGTIGHSGPYDKLLSLEDAAVPYEKTENANQFREAGKYLFGFLDNTEEELDFDPVAEALKRTGMPFYSKNKDARGRVKTAAMDYAQDSMVAGMGEGYIRAASGGEFLYKGGKFLKDKLFLDEADDSDILDYVNSAIEFDALNHRYENSAELAAFVLENPQESVKAMGAGLVGGLTPIVEAEDLNEILIDEEDINLDSDLQQDIRSGFVQPDVGVSFLSEVIGDPMNLAGGTTAKAVTAPQRVALSGKITQTLNEVTKLNQGKGMAIRALEKFPEDSLIAQRQAKFLEAANQSLAQKQKVLDKYARNSMFLRMAAQSSPDELLKVAAQNIDTASDAGKASMNMVYNAMKPSGKMGIARKGIAMGAKLTPEIAGATIGASLAGPEGAALGAITPSLIKAAKIVSTMPENVAISYIMRSAAEAGEEITEQAARKQWRGITKYLYPTGILGIGIGSATDGREEGGSNALLKFGAGALSLKALPKIAKFADAAIRDSRIIGPELIYARGSEASPFFNRLALLPSGEEGLIGANADRFQALTRTSSGETILEKAIDKVRPIGRGIATSVTDEFPTGAPFRPGLSDTNKMLSNPTRKVAQFLDRNPALGRSIETLGRFGTVVTAGSTLPAAFGYVGSGGQAEGAIAGALVSAPFTSIGAGAGMFQAYKNKSDLFQQKMGDVYYYREHLNKSEQADFDKLPMEARMGLAGYSLSHPDILFKPLPADKMEGQGNWSFDENTGTSIVQFDKDTGAGLVEGVLAHEVGHHIEIHGLTPMVNKIFFGDQVTGEAGIYGKFNEEGEIVPNQAFEDKRTLYLNRLVKDASIKPENLDQYQGKEGNKIIAKEIFAETVRDYLLSGKKNKGNTAIEKMITSASNAMMGTSFVRDFLLKFNLPMKADGKFIEGGPFGGTLKRNPALTKLIDQYYSDTRALRQREIQGDEITTPGSGRVDKKLSADGRRPIGGDDFESSFSLKDQNDPAIKAKLDTGGIFKWRPTADGKGSELETGATGTPKRYTAGELKKEQRIQGDHAIKVFEDNGIEIITNKEGKKSTGDITNLTSKMIDELAAGPWHPRQIQSLREISRSLREGDGERAGFLIGYFAKSSGRKPKAVPFTLRQEMPYGFKLTNDGNILVLLHDVPQLEKNLKFLKSGRRLPGKYKDEYNQLFSNDTEVWKAFQQYRINTANGMDGQLGLDDKPAKAMRKKNFLNALHGAIDKEHIKLNPILLEISNLEGMDMFNPKKTSPFGPATKTFRLDGIFDVTRSGNRNSNVNLDRVRTLLMPRQSKNYDKKIALRTNESLIELVDKIANEEGVSRNDVLNRILQEKFSPEEIKTPDSEIVPPSLGKESQNLSEPTLKKYWSEDSDQDLNWLQNDPRKKLFMPAETVDPNVRKANKYARQFKDAQKNDKIIIKEAREEWRDLGFESENFQEFMRGNETGIPPVLADEKAGNYIPKKMYYTGQIGTPQGANYDRSIDVVKMVRDKVDNRESHRWNPDETIILTQDRKRAREIQKEIDPEHIPLVMATNAKYIFDVTIPEHLSILKNHISEIPNKQISSEKEMLVQRPGMINPDIITKDAEFDYKPTDLPTDYSNVNLFENELKSNGWHGYKFTDSKGEHFAIFDSRRVKLIEDQSAESKVYSKDRPFGKVSGLFGKQIPSDRMSSVPKRDIRFMPQMELDFDGKSKTTRPTEQPSQGISFWKLFGIDKNDKQVYKKVAEKLINTGSPDMDPQTALDYGPRLGLNTKRLRQEMVKAQRRDSSSSNKYFMPNDRDYMHTSGGIILPDGSFIKAHTGHKIDLFDWVENNPKNPFAQKMKRAEKFHDERYGEEEGFNVLEAGLNAGAIRVARDPYNPKNIYIESSREIPSRLRRELIDQAMMTGNTLIRDRGPREQIIFQPENKLFMPASEAGATKGKVAEAAKLWNEKGIDSPYFKKWFDKSKVVDDNGEPLVVYHGTDKQFTSFDPEKSIGGQHWFTSDKSAIESGEVGAQGKGVIMETYLNIKKPAGWAEYDKFTIDELLGRGYDGLILPESDGTATYVAYSPEQIKSATGNRGTFDAGERNILFMPSDSNYLKAVDQGDMQAAQQMVDQKARENGFSRKYHHGTSNAGKKDILNNGIDQMRSEKGYFGRGFYAADDITLAKENYAEFSGDEGGGSVVSFVIPDSAKILDLKNSKDFETYKKLKHRGRPVESLISVDNFNEIMVGLGIDGLKDESFGGIVIYNEKLVKSADPINYDSKGNPIPLSKRFDSSKDSILYMPSDPKAPKAQPANRIQQQAPAMPGNRFMAPASSAGAKLSERFGK